MEKINILYLYSSKGFAGIPRNLALITGHINHQRFSCSAALIGDPNDEAADFRGRAVSTDSLRTFHRLGSGGKFEFGVIEEVRKIIEEEKVDILSCHGYKADFYGALIKLFYRPNIKFTTIAHGWVTGGFKLTFYYLLDKLCMGFFDKVVLVEEGQRKQIKGISQDKLVVVNNAVDYEAFSASSRCEPMYKELGVSEQNLLICFSGRLSSEKDNTTALQAFKIIADEMNEVDFVLIGEGPEREELEQLSRTLGIEDRVSFVGYRENMKALYSLFDVYLSCSRREGLPNSVLEAMAAGVPCVLSAIDGHKAIAEHEKNALFAPVGKPASFAEQIKRLLNDKTLTSEIRDEARKVVRKKFSISKRLERLEFVYKGLVGESSVETEAAKE